MNKKLACLLAMLMITLCTFCSCSQNESQANMYNVFEIQQQSYSDSVKLNHSFNLDDSTSQYSESISSPKTSFSINENMIELDYEYSQLESLTGIKSHAYQIDNQYLNDQQKACMDRYLVKEPIISFEAETGRLLGIQYPFDSIVVSTEMSNDEIRVQAEQYLTEAFDIDFTRYEEVNVTRSEILDDPQSSIGYWSIEWYRIEKGHKLADSVSIIILRNGYMMGLRINPMIDADDVLSSPNLYERGSDIENEIIDKKIKSIYNTPEAELVSWNNSTYESELYAKNGTLYIEYLVEVEYVEKATNCEWGEVCNIVVEIPQ